MTQALNLANFANKLNTSGQADTTALQAGTYGISISGNAATATNAGHATSADSATTAGNGGVTSVDSATGAVILANLASFGRSLTANGYQKLPGGLIVQWGTATIPNGVTGQITVNFPITFPTAFFGAQTTINLSIAPSYATLIDNTSASSMRINLYYTTGTPTPIFWMAIGY